MKGKKMHVINYYGGLMFVVGKMSPENKKKSLFILADEKIKPLAHFVDDEAAEIFIKLLREESIKNVRFQTVDKILGKTEKKPAGGERENSS